MSGLETLGFSVGAAFASGLNLYATAAILGLLQRYEVVDLPQSLHVLSHPIVLGIAVALYAIEFIADKVPYIDSLWDAIHTFIRPPAAALLAYGAFADVPREWQVAGGLLAGSIALTAHGAKASSRAAINASPEPFSNWIASLAEDGIAVFLAWMAVNHPALSLILVSALLVLAIYLFVKLAKFFRRLLRPLGRSPAA